MHCTVSIGIPLVPLVWQLAHRTERNSVVARTRLEHGAVEACGKGTRDPIMKWIFNLFSLDFSFMSVRHAK